MKKFIKTMVLSALIGCSITFVGCSIVKNNGSGSIPVSASQSSFTEKEVKKTIDGIYQALMNKNSEEYISYINSESLGHLGSSGEEIKTTIDDYLKGNAVKEYKILSIEDFNENTKIVNTKYVEVAEDGHSLEHDDMIFLQKNLESNKVEIIYNGAISSENFPLAEVPKGEYKFQLEKTTELFDGIGATINLENNTDYRVSIGYGSILGSVILTTEDGDSYTLPFDELKLYNPTDKDKVSSYTYETTAKISKVEIQGVFELNEDGTPKEGSPKSLVIYERES